MGMKSNIIQIREKKYIAKYYYETLDLSVHCICNFFEKSDYKKMQQARSLCLTL